MTWTLVSPLTWSRTFKQATDEFGRPIDSFGSCSNDNALAFVIVLLILNLGMLVLANWWAYQARNIETEYHESRYIAISMASVLQAWCMGIPILIVVWDNPQAKFFVGTGIVFVTSLAVLALIFLPKVWAIREDHRRAAADEKRQAYMDFAERKKQGYDDEQQQQQQQLSHEQKEDRYGEDDTTSMEVAARIATASAAAESSKTANASLSENVDDQDDDHLDELPDKIIDTEMHDAFDDGPAETIGMSLSSAGKLSPQASRQHKFHATPRGPRRHSLFSPGAMKSSEAQAFANGGIKVLHNPRSSRNLRMAHGREMSRAQLANLKWREDDSSSVNGRDGSSTNVQAETTSAPLPPMPPSPEGSSDQLESVQE